MSGSEKPLNFEISIGGTRRLKRTAGVLDVPGSPSSSSSLFVAGADLAELRVVAIELGWKMEGREQTCALPVALPGVLPNALPGALPGAPVCVGNDNKSQNVPRDFNDTAFCS